MTDEKLAPVLRSWLKTRDVAPPDATQSAGRVMTRLPQVRQRGRWWPLPIFGRAPVMPPAISDTDSRPAPIPVTNDHSPTVIGRTYTMFSPVKAITAGALVFALGGVLLIAQPFDQQGGIVPGAATDAEGESTAVTGTSVCGPWKAGSPQLSSLPYSLTGQVLRCTETASDPRVTGTNTAVINVEGWDESLQREVPINAVTWNDFTLEGPDGTWSGHGYGFYDADGVLHVVHISSGSGAYEGLTYTTSSTARAGTGQLDFIGLIQTSSPPPGFPVAPPPEPASE
jgi:hypothetical protein